MPEESTGAPASPGAARTAWLVYDGACPFCSRYASLVRVREAVGGLELVDARRGGPLVEEVVAAGLDLDQGMVLKLDQRLYHGAECLHVLALLSSRSDAFNRWTAAILRSRSAARLLYPMLRAGRNAALLLLGRTRLNRPPAVGTEDAAWSETKGLDTMSRRTRPRSGP